MKKRLVAFLGVIDLMTNAAYAGAGHDHGPKQGGVVREVGALNYELVAKPDLLTLFVSDHGKAVSTAGAKAQVTLYAGNDKTVVALEPAGENRMTAKGSFKVGVGVRAALAIALPGKNEAKATFNLK